MLFSVKLYGLYRMSGKSFSQTDVPFILRRLRSLEIFWLVCFIIASIMTSISFLGNKLGFLIIPLFIIAVVFAIGAFIANIIKCYKLISNVKFFIISNNPDVNSGELKVLKKIKGGVSLILIFVIVAFIFNLVRGALIKDTTAQAYVSIAVVLLENLLKAIFAFVIHQNIKKENLSSEDD